MLVVFPGCGDGGAIKEYTYLEKIERSREVGLASAVLLERQKFY